MAKRVSQTTGIPPGDSELRLPAAQRRNSITDRSLTDRIDTVKRLEELAAWHRMHAERAGSDWVWEARLLTAEDLERRAAELRVNGTELRRYTSRQAMDTPLEAVENSSERRQFKSRGVQ